jgi:hypothetical protein
MKRLVHRIINSPNHTWGDTCIEVGLIASHENKRYQDVRVDGKNSRVKEPLRKKILLVESYKTNGWNASLR